ncbi:MAG: serpin family protein [Gemmatimonadota bacterium]
MSDKIIARSVLAFALLALPLAAACDLVGPDDGPPEPIEALPRALTAAEEELIARSNDFAFELLRETYARQDESPNVFLSPLSASMALGMTLNGAGGETFDSMRATLGLEGLEQEQINRSYRDLTELLLELDPRVELAIANSTWAREGIPFYDSFFDAVTTWFDAEARELDFDDPATVDAINDWAAENTNDRIERVIEEIRDEHILFLLNAVYFHGQWTDRFDPDDTRRGRFTLADGTEVEVDQMNGDPNAGLTNADGVTIGELPYGGQAFVMNVVLPPRDGSLTDLVATLDADAWSRWTDAIGPYDSIGVTLPKFEIEYGDTLNAALTALGMGNAFDPARADFTRLTPLAEANGVWIDFVKQNTFLKVDEEGTEAAAATTVAISAVSAGPQLVVDRPFLLVIRERLSGTILFIGAIGDPREE